MSTMPDWVKKFPGAVTVCDKNLQILYMNEKSVEVFEKDGGAKLIGSDLLPCHNEQSRLKVLELLKTGFPNVYTIEKKGIKKFIYQTAWSDEGGIAGLIELSLEIPFEMPHFVRS